MCEAFHCVPSVAERELDQHADLVFDILDLRAAADAYRAYRASDSLDSKARKKLLQNELVQEVQQMDYADAQEAINRGQRNSGD